MTKIIYMDIDGTLRDEREGIAESARKAVQACREQGIYLVICTGRNLGSVQDDVLALGMDGIISAGGCDIRFQGKILAQKYFSMKLLGEILEAVRKRKLGAALEAETEIYMNGKAAGFYQEDFGRKISGCENAQQIREKNKIRYEDNFSQLWKDCEKIHKICLWGTKDHIQEITKKFLPDVQVVQEKEWNQSWYLELLPRGCGKGKAVKFLNRYLNIKKEDSMSFGDGDNDIKMLKASGIGIAVQGGSEELIKYADSVCGSPKENGVFLELCRRGILHQNG